MRESVRRAGPSAAANTVKRCRLCISIAVSSCAVVLLDLLVFGLCLVSLVATDVTSSVVSVSVPTATGGGWLVRMRVDIQCSLSLSAHSYR